MTTDETRVCCEVECWTELSRYNTSDRCWWHGGWDERTLSQAIEALLTSLVELEMQRNPLAKRS